MKVKDFAGNFHNWPPTGHVAQPDDIRPKSELHLKCRQLLKELYPTRPPLEEVPIPGTRLLIDFVLPHRNICIEVQGQQHYNDIFFFNSKADFERSKQRDRQKSDWCTLNNLILIELKYNESIEEWKKKLL